MRKLFIFCVLVACLYACKKQPTDAMLAQEYVDKASEMVEQGNYNGAKMKLDSVHLLFPKSVEIRRIAKHLSDSINFIEAQKNFSYADSIRIVLDNRLTELKKEFTYEINEKYENVGRYYYKNMSRAIGVTRIEAFVVGEGQEVQIRSFYAGKNLNHNRVGLSFSDIEVVEDGSLYEMTGGEEMTTIGGVGALNLLKFLNSQGKEKVMVLLIGEKEYKYQLTESAQKALNKTYELYILMSDLQGAQKLINTNGAIIERWKQKNH